MRRSTALFAAIAAVSCLVAAPRVVGAAEPADDEEAEDTTPARPPAADGLTGTWHLTAGLGLAVPAGKVDASRAMSALSSTGTSLGAAVGWGVSRYVEVEGRGGFAALSAPSGCASCSAGSWSLGAGLVYHLAQGIAVDPWGSFGLGYRSTSFEVPAARSALLGGTTTARYRSLDVARLGLGADFYAVRSIGLGPALTLDVSRTLGRADGLDAGAGTEVIFQLGLRVVLQPNRSFTRASQSARR